MEEEMETVTERQSETRSFYWRRSGKLKKEFAAARLEVMRADAPAPVSPSIDSEFETIAEPPAHLIAERAKQLQLQEKARGTNISISQAVAAIMPATGDGIGAKKISCRMTAGENTQ